MKIGFIGLGIMGAPMARHLIDAGHELFVHTRSKVPGESLRAAATPAPTRREVARAGRGRLPDAARHARRRAVLFGEDGVAAGLSARARPVVDMSSISPIATKAFAAADQRARAADYIDAPVSGGEVGAKAAIADDHVRRRPRRCSSASKPLFEKMGKNITLVGGNGDGQTTKVANQIIVALNIAAVGEALLFASKAGADPAKVRQALMGGFAASPHPRGARRADDQAHVQSRASASRCTRRT